MKSVSPHSTRHHKDGDAANQQLFGKWAKRDVPSYLFYRTRSEFTFFFAKSRQSSPPSDQLPCSSICHYIGHPLHPCCISASPPLKITPCGCDGLWKQQAEGLGGQEIWLRSIRRARKSVLLLLSLPRLSLFPLCGLRPDSLSFFFMFSFTLR